MLCGFLSLIKFFQLKMLIVVSNDTKTTTYFNSIRAAKLTAVSRKTEFKALTPGPNLQSGTRGKTSQPVEVNISI